MGLDATTYVLEILNFLVLLWLLRRYLFQPLLKVIRQRQQEAENIRQQQQAARAQLEQERQQLAQQQTALQEAHAQAQQRLMEEIELERQKRLKALGEEVLAERAKAAARLAATAEQQAHEQQQRVAEQALSFLQHYLQRLASPELEQAIIRLFVEDLAHLDDAVRNQLLAQTVNNDFIRVSTAYPTTPEQRQQLEQQLSQHLPPSLQYQWLENPRLLAGLAIELDGHILEASLAAGLDAFSHPPAEAA